MYELQDKTARIIKALYDRKDDEATITTLSRILSYSPEQLKEDIQALHDYHMAKEGKMKYGVYKVTIWDDVDYRKVAEFDNEEDAIKEKERLQEERKRVFKPTKEIAFDYIHYTVKSDLQYELITNPTEEFYY